MNRHASDNLIDAYVTGVLKADEILLLEEHLLVCGECLDAVEATLALVATLRKPGPAAGAEPRRTRLACAGHSR